MSNDGKPADEDMSIAVGEDLFPFFRKTGKPLAKDRFGKTVFQGQTMPLSIAPIEPTPPGHVCLDAIGDDAKPIPVRPQTPVRESDLASNDHWKDAD